ncbi:branched-chain amino acid ABC transporter permease [Petrocella sp. FN5]|uniref:branched-chain amino acid ABC transporter permease n=1 Tax=Petrocella sp. FN5 TaxID=3032002 RepID=UPI0023DC81D3|nr:branched-chain amino acid ABC transporter permease [Petrocella sp. FN5]MDF1616463.1 branched-chain amino acid ABC transporter permease [Petrocella sp. FN5]
MDKKVVSGYLKNITAIMVVYAIVFYLIQIKVINNYYNGILILAGIYIIVAASLNLATGYLGQLALGHAGFMAIGAYTAALFAIAVDLPKYVELVAGLILGGLMAGIFGLIIGIPALRLRGDYLGIVTLGFGEIIRIALLNLPFTGGAAGLKGIPRYVNFTEIYFLVVVVIAFLFAFIRSRHGRAILSIKEDEIAAESVGIPTTFYKVYGFVVSAFIAGVGGGALGFYQRILDPKKFNFMFSVEFFIIVVLGGMGSITGTIIAALALAFINEFLYSIDELRLVFYALTLIILMIFKPDGLLGRKEFSLIKLLNRFSKKTKIENAD